MKKNDIMKALLPWKKEDICPCGSELKYGNCCHREGDWPLVQIPPFLPAPKPNEKPYPKCYMESFGGCGGEISREHYISRAILEELGELEFTGLPWLKPGETQIFSPSSMTVKVLCEAHNNALSPIDKLGLRSFRNMRKAVEEIIPISILSTISHTLISGTALEFWGLKCLLGMYFGGIAAAEGKPINNQRSIDRDLLRNIMETRSFPPDCGLYVMTSARTYQSRISVGPLSTDTQVIGLYLQLYTFEFHIIFDPTGVNFDMFKRNAIFRPQFLRMDCQTRTTFIVMSYEQPVDLNHVSIGVEPVILKK